MPKHTNNHNENATFEVWLRLSNFVAIICSLGFAMPWAKIRSARFYANATQVDILQGADGVVADKNTNASAIGDEIANAFDINVGI